MKRSWKSSRAAAGALFLVAYLPLLLSAPGKIPGDTKLYLYLDPWRLISDSLWTWDSRQLGGWVPHQNIGYLWPTGPWFAGFDALGIPDWIAHRLWLGTMMLSAGLGVLWLARRMGLRPQAAFIAALAYQLSPFVLPYISRTSALLLPWALLPWLCGVAAAYAIQRRWFHLAIFGALVLSSGGLNATALLMIAPGPLIWLIHLWRGGHLSTRQVFSAVGILGSVSFLVSCWWLIGLFIQGRYGAAVLSYSEALASTAATSTAPEVLRGLGYWIFYDRNDIVSLTSAATDYQGNLIVMAAGGVLVLTALWGIMSDIRWRWVMMTLILVGVILAVGPYPFHDPSPLWSLAADNPRQAISLALRSSTRAVPIVVLALALGLGLFAEKCLTGQMRIFGSSSRKQIMPLFGVVILITLNIPALLNGRLIDPVMTRPNDLPEAWKQVAAYLDERFDQGHTGSVLILPGIESAAYRWGYPVDPILPGLTKKPLISRDWLPLGSAPLMDLVYALDDSFQSGTAQVEAIAPVARLIGADTVMVVNSHQYERFGTIRPERARAIFGPNPPGLALLESFGPELLNQAPPRSDLYPSWSEDLVAHPHQLLPEIQVYAVQDPAPTTRVSTAIGLVAGDGSGLVDLATAGVLSGQHLYISEASLDDADLIEVMAAAPEVLITDSNRRRAHHWRSSQDVWGATESSGGVLLTEDLFDSRLPVFPSAQMSSQTIVAAATISARATGYGPDLTFHPEHRPRMAIDGNLDSAWRVGTLSNPVGEILEISSDGESLSQLRLVQPLDANPLRWITAVAISADDGAWLPLKLNGSSQTPTGQVFSLIEPATKVSIRIEEINYLNPMTLNNGPGVGFAEVVDSAFTSAEVLRVPERIQGITQSVPATSFLFSRLRADPLSRWRQDPELSIERSFTTAQDASFTASMQVRLNHRSSDRLLLQALGISQINNRPAQNIGTTQRLSGSASWWGLAALDGDPTTQWWTSSSLDLAASSLGYLSLPLENPVKTLTLQQVVSSTASRITGVSLEFISAGTVQERLNLDVPPPDSTGASLIEVPARQSDEVKISISTIEPTWVIDDISGVPVAAPVGVIDISSDGWQDFSIPDRFDTECRDDLISLNGRPIEIRIAGLVSQALAGEPIEAEICAGIPLQLDAGTHSFSTSSGLESGWDIDTVVLRDSQRLAMVEAEVVSLRPERGLRVLDGFSCQTPCWVEVSDGWNSGWSARSAGQELPPPFASSAGRNMWLLEPSEAHSVTVTWTPQRAMWWALGVSGATMTMLGLGALRARKRSGPNQSVSLAPLAAETQGHAHTSSSVWLALIVGLVVINPLWGVALGVIVFFQHRQPRTLAHLGGALVALGFAFLMAQQIRTGAEPGFGWPSVFARAHRPTLAGLVLLWVVASADPTRRRLQGSRARDSV